jgi:hypothetical protein
MGAAMLLMAPILSAQRLLHLGVGGGTDIPVGRYGVNRTAAGNMLAILTGGLQDSPFGWRLDYSYNQFKGHMHDGEQIQNSHLNVVTANLVASLPMEYTKPYVIVGGGWYPVRDTVTLKQNNDIGVNLGLGITFPFLSGAWFLEGRYHRIFQGPTVGERFIPINIGVLF